LKHTEWLKYNFTEKELREFAKELARETALLAEAEEQKKAIVASFSEKVATAKTKLSILSRYINNGYDYRNVDCSVLMDSPKDGMKTVYRDDTGEEVKIAPMTPEEKQYVLTLASDEKPEATQ
jgi:hypothetical protein